LLGKDSDGARSLDGVRPPLSCNLSALLVLLLPRLLGRWEGRQHARVCGNWQLCSVKAASALHKVSLWPRRGHSSVAWLHLSSHARNYVAGTSRVFLDRKRGEFVGASKRKEQEELQRSRLVILDAGVAGLAAKRLEASEIGPAWHFVKTARFSENVDPHEYWLHRILGSAETTR